MQSSLSPLLLLKKGLSLSPTQFIERTVGYRALKQLRQSCTAQGSVACCQLMDRLGFQTRSFPLCYTITHKQKWKNILNLSLVLKGLQLV